MPVALYSVCAALQEDTPDNRQTAQAQMAALTQLLPNARVAHLCGSVELAKLPWLLRTMLSKAGESGEMKLGDYRDGDAIRAWAGELTAAWR